MANKPSVLAQLHPNPKLEKYRNEVLKWKTKVEEAEVKVEQSEHSLTLEENRIETKSKESRAARTHRLCVRAGHLESLIPETKELTDDQFMKFCDALLSFPGIRAHIKRTLFELKLMEEE